MKKEQASHIALTSHFSVEDNCFFSRGTRRNANATATSLKNQDISLCWPVHELPLAHQIAAWWAVFKYRATSREQWVIQIIDCCGVSIVGATPVSAGSNPEQPDLTLKLHLTLKLALLWVGIGPGKTERPRPTQVFLSFSPNLLKWVTCIARMTK